MRSMLAIFVVGLLVASVGRARADCAAIQTDLTKIAIAYNTARQELDNVIAELAALPTPGDASAEQNIQRNQLKARQANKSLRRDELFQKVEEWAARAAAECNS